MTTTVNDEENKDPFENGLLSIQNLLSNISEDMNTGLTNLNKNFDSLNQSFVFNIEKLLTINVRNSNLLSLINDKLTKIYNKNSIPFKFPFTNEENLTQQSILRDDSLSKETELISIELCVNEIKKLMYLIENNISKLTNKYLETNMNADRFDNKLASSQLFNKMNDIFEKFIIRGNTTNIEQVFSDDRELTNGINSIDINLQISNNRLLDIFYQIKLTNKLIKLLSRKNTDKRDLEKEETKSKVKSKSNIFVEMAEGVNKMKDVLTSDFIKNFRAFVNAFNNFINIDTTKVIQIKVTLLALVNVFGIISSKAEDVAKGFNALSMSVILMTLVLISPPFLLGAAVLIGILWGIRKALSGAGILFGWNIKKLAIGIIYLAGAIWLIGKLEWDNIMKMITFIGALSIVIRLTESKSGFKGSLFGFAMGITLITLAMYAIAGVPFAALFKMIFFITTLSLAIGISSRIAGGNKMPPLLAFAFGLGLLTIAIAAFGELPFDTLERFIKFIAILGIELIIINNIKGCRGVRGLTGFAFGMGLLVIALFAFGDLEWYDLFRLISFITLLGIAIAFAMTVGSKKGWSIPGISVSGSSGLTSFALSLAFLALSLWIFNYIKWDSVFKLIFFVGGLGIVLKLFTNTKVGLSLIGLAFGLFAISLGLKFLKGTNFNIDDALQYAGVIGIFTGILYLLGTTHISKTIIMGSIILSIITGSCLISTYVISKIGELDINFANLFKFVGSVAILSLMIMLIKPFLIPLTIGALALIGISVSLMLSASVIKSISMLDINFKNIGFFILGVLMLAGTFAILTPLLGVGMLAALLLLPMSLVCLSIATTFKLIENLSLENTGAFLLAVAGLALGFSVLYPIAGMALAGALLFLPLAITALFLSACLMNIQKLDIDPKKMDNFTEATKNLVKMIDGFGVISLTKGAAKALLLLPIMGSLLLTSLVLKAIDKLDVDKRKVLGFGDTISEFTDAILDSLSENENKFKKSKSGIEALGKLVGISKSLADTIQAMANLEFYEHEVKDGKIVLKNVRKLGPEDFKRVGQNMAAMLNCLVEPLTILGKNENTWNIGGRKIINPFKDSKSKKGIEMLSKLGNAFKPFAEGVSEFAKSPLLSDKTLLQSFKTSFISLIYTFGSAFNIMSDWDNNKPKKAIKNIKELLEFLDGVEKDGIKSLNSSIDNLITKLSDEDKWTKINKHLGLLKEQFSGIVNTINKLDLTKATAFEKNIRLLVDKNQNSELKEVLEKLLEVMNLMSENNENNYVINTQQSQQPVNNYVQPINNTQQPTLDLNVIVSQITEVLGSLISINTGITGVNEKLGDKIKVQLVGQNANLIR